MPYHRFYFRRFLFTSTIFLRCHVHSPSLLFCLLSVATLWGEGLLFCVLTSYVHTSHSTLCHSMNAFTHSLQAQLIVA
ncbi:hypothetical protein EV361DRAFT_937580 [Lentinula raphanica]|nr:hypothetical protein EV361DRAFT_937580 [Lentinula raphanica]